jgi:MFS family permease
MAGLQGGVLATSPSAYSLSLATIAIGGIGGLVPLFLLKTPRLKREERSLFAPFTFFAKNTKLLGRLILPMLVTSLGAGLIMPFMNVFFRNVHNQPDPVIGSLFAWGSLAMGVGLLIAPPLADRFGKIQVVVITQALSIPFLFMLGFSPWFFMSAAAYYVRLTLMNMSLPVYQTFVMERVDQSARATVASLVSMANSVGWAFSPQISGWIQVNYGFQPAFAVTLVLYIISIYLYWRYFWYPDRAKTVELEPTAATFGGGTHLRK